MQERYLGDVHDYYKFLFLKSLSEKLKKKIGLNWYLVDPEEISVSEQKKKDGEKRNYLNKYEIYNLDLKISNEFKKIVDKKNRNIENFTNQTHLKSYINFFNKRIQHSNRKQWFKESIEFFKNNEVIFLDPDNGLLKSKYNKNPSKYLLLDEIDIYLSKRKIVIFTQFQSYNKTHIIYLKEIKNYLKLNNIEILLPIIRNRTAPNTFFITLCDGKMLDKERIISFYKVYERKMPETIELITV